MAVRRAVVGWAAALVISAGLLALPLVAFAATSSVNIQNSAFAPATTPPTAPPTPAPTEAPTPEATTAPPSATPSPPSTPSETASPSPSAAAAQLTPAPNASGGVAPLLIGAAALAVVVLGAIALFLARRS